MVADHGAAGAGGDYYVFGSFESFQKMLGDSAGFVAVAAVEGGLCAAGLGFAKFEVATGAFEDVCHCDSDAWKNLIDYAGYEEGDANH
jgi:hypothetical protein